jgi:hypothetical protein
MIKSSLSILTLTICLQSCSSGPKPLTKTEKFELKARCAGYWDSAVREFQSAGGPTVEELFYSPKLNTCVVALSGTNAEGWAVEDILSHHKYIFYELTKEHPDAEKQWEAKIEELKANGE